MKTVLENIQKQLGTIPSLKYIDEDWGQLDDYSPHPPTQFPLALIDIGSIEFSHIGMDKKVVPQNRQMATGTIVITVANLRLTNTSLRSPKQQKDNVWEIWNVIECVHQELHGFKPDCNSGAMMRTALRRIKRDDGIQEYEITYTIGISNV
jgi:hypothetical protein